MRTLLTFLFLILTLTAAYAQRKLQGKVTDQNGQPLSNASIFIAESRTGTKSDVEGNFILYPTALGKFKIVVSYIGYESQVKSIAIQKENELLNFMLKPISNQLKDVIITSRSKNGWKTWGQIFTEAFIGGSVFAGNCTLMNHEVLSFDYDDSTKVLKAYATEPVLIRNEDLGYFLTITLVDFTLYTASNDVDYQAYYLFKDLANDARLQEQWNKNRRKAYSLSFMHFARSLYRGQLKEDGFEVREFRIPGEAEKERVKKIYHIADAHDQDSMKHQENISATARKLFEKKFSKDSIRYYRSVLSEKHEIKLSEPLKVGDIALKKNGHFVALSFKNELQVTYKRIREPDEYYKFRNQTALTAGGSALSGSTMTADQFAVPEKLYPYTELSLTKGRPVEVLENGYIINTNLYLHGFWGWWEKMATKLPYDYQP